jgi:2',3'-cyclic-nucleotide 2'-phosphodiesterase/3'-nucleotidase
VIQGTLLGDLQAVTQPVTCAQTLAVHKAMNLIKYHVGGLGNHEFNYGLPFLSQITNTDFGITGVTKPAGTCGAPQFPMVLTNVTGTTSNRPIFQPYTILQRDFAANKPDGSSTTVKLNVGVMSFVPPQILDWDQKYLAGKVAVSGAKEAATQYVPEIRSKGADLVVALSHGGWMSAPTARRWRTRVITSAGTGVDALLIGHRT